MLLVFIPILGSLTLLIFFLLSGTKGDNKYGQDPYANTVAVEQQPQVMQAVQQQTAMPQNTTLDATTMPVEVTQAPVEPTIQTQPEVMSTEPEAMPTEPTTTPVEPSTMPMEPTTMPTEPSTNPTEPTTPQEPVA